MQHNVAAVTRSCICPLNPSSLSLFLSLSISPSIFLSLSLSLSLPPSLSLSLFHLSLSHPSQVLSHIAELLGAAPEGEQLLLQLLVNKLADGTRKVASKASYLLSQLLQKHSGMHARARTVL